MAITIMGMRSAPTVIKSQMAISPSVCPTIRITITYIKSISFHTYVEHIVVTLCSHMIINKTLYTKKVEIIL